jgi:beta-lactamase class A
MAPRAPVAPSPPLPPRPRRRAVAMAVVAGFLAGAAITFGVLGRRPPPADAPNEERHEGQRGLINPLLECATERGLGSAREVERSVIAYLERQRPGPATRVAIYFRDLNNGPWFGVNEKEHFVPSSLNKVQILVEYLKAAQADPALLRRSVTFVATREDDATVPNIRGSQSLVDGTTYTIAELLRRMIVYSDNSAAGLLIEGQPGGEHFDICPDDSPFPCPGGMFRSVSVVHYASVFRVLFNASYLDRATSQLALDLLTQVEYRDGLVAGVPPGTVVAHKFGEGIVGSSQHLHDCGIVYYPGAPYLLCVMTRGSDFGSMSRIIRDVSRHTYEAVARLHRRPR